LTKAWEETILSGLSLEACKVRVFDNGTTIQFRDNDRLARFRDRARAVLSEPVAKLVATYSSGLIQPMLDDCTKSRGPKAFGSIARSPCRSDKSDLRWEMALDKPVPLTFKRVHLLVSDDALTNPRDNDEDYPIP
jgi:hypothetical protein